MNKFQRTETWFRDRCGKLTASRISRVINGGPAVWARLMDELEAEIERGTSDNGQPSTGAMQHGIDQEDAAIALYEMIYTDCEPVERCGFLVHPDIDYIGASPDFLQSDNVGECKCPFNSIYHEQTRTYGMPAEHIPQVQTQMFVTGKPQAVFLSYDPRAEPSRQLYRQIIPADPAYHKRIRDRCAEFWAIFQRGERPEAVPSAIPSFF
jgi:hypothetical protein